MREFDYKAFYDRVGAENGWDFSRIKVQTDGAGLNLYSEMMKRTVRSGILLDIGTGGGEAVLSISDSVLLLVGIDNSPGMISTAKANLVKQKKVNVRFFLMDALDLAFPIGFFDLVTCRHSDFSAKQVFRVLGQGGVFLTQQVSEDDKSNIKQFFGRGQSFGNQPGTLKKHYLEALRDAGFNHIQTDESNVTEYYSRPEDLIFLLKHTPILPDFGENENDFVLLDEFIQANMTERGIATTASRFMIVATK